MSESAKDAFDAGVAHGMALPLAERCPNCEGTGKVVAYAESPSTYPKEVQCQACGGRGVCERCNDIGPGGFVCMLAKGHTGNHVGSKVWEQKILPLPPMPTRAECESIIDYRDKTLDAIRERLGR